MEHLKNDLPLVTIVVPVYNVANYLERCLNSICAQTYQNIEILLIDDGSTDNSGHLCDCAAETDSRIHVIHQKNAGLSGARNTGISRARGGYIAFIDSDDYISPCFIEALLKVALCTNSQIAQSYVKDVDFQPVVTVEKNMVCDAAKAIGQIVTLNGREMCASLLDSTYADCGVVWNKLYDISLFQKLRFPVGKIHEDDFLVCKLYWEARRIAICETPLYFYQLKRPDSIMNAKYSLKRLDALQARKEQYEFFTEMGDPELSVKAKAEYIRSTTVQIKHLRKSDIPDSRQISRTLRKQTAPILRECLQSPYLSIRTKTGLLYRLLISLA